MQSSGCLRAARILLSDVRRFLHTCIHSYRLSAGRLDLSAPGRDHDLFRYVFRERQKVDCIIVLGAQVKGKKITDSLKRRLDRAALYLKKYPDTRVIVSGGQGPGEEISEADAMAAYLIRSGIDRERIIREDQSTSTSENLRYSRKYTDPEREDIGIVTNGFHMYRALLIAGQEGYRNAYKIPASSNPVFQINYLMREFFAVVHVWLKMMKK